jgi:hypothetical protein
VAKKGELVWFTNALQRRPSGDGVLGLVNEEGKEWVV